MPKNGKARAHGNGRGPKRNDGKIRVAIVGVGNCASSLVQGRYYYENAKDDDFVPGLMHVNLGGYHVRDIEFVAAFDIDKNKVGKDLSEAIYTKPNNTYVFQQVPEHRRQGRARHDPRRPRQVPQPDHREGARPDGRHRRHPQGARGRRHGLVPAGRLARRRPSGTSSRRSRPASASSTPSRCSSAASRTGSAASPRKACRSSATTSRARSARRSRHRVLTRLFMDRGVRLDRTYQLNFGGNTDFLNMLERERLESKKISKTNAVTLDARLRDRRGRHPRRPVATTCRGCWTGSGATSGWRARPTATCRSTPSSSSRSGTAPTAPASSPTPSAA